MKLILICVLAVVVCACGVRVDPEDDVRTFGTAIKNGRMSDRGVEQTVFEFDGKGIMTYFWMTGGWKEFGDSIVRYYVDGETNASIVYPLFLGHGIGHDDNDIVPHGTEFMGRLAHGSVYDTNRVPFSKSVKVTVECTVDGNPTFWVVIRGVENYWLMFNDFLLPDTARLCTAQVRNVTLNPLDFVTMLDVKGTGMLYQVTLDGDSADYNFLEACVRAYIDTSEDPLYLSSGTEDFARSAFYFNAGPYSTPLAALTHFDGKGAMSFYTLFDRDPIFFSKEIKLTWRNNEDASCPSKWGIPPVAEEVRVPITAPVVVNTFVWYYVW